MKKQLLTVALFMGTWIASAQVGVGTLEPNKSSQLDVKASDKGILIPRVSLTGITDQATITKGNVESLLVYNKNENQEVTPGYYYWFDGQWRRMLTPSDIASDVLTVLTFDPLTNTLTYLDEEGISHDLTLNNTKNSTIVLNGTTLIVTDTDGDTYQVDLSSLTNTTKVTAGTNVTVTGNGSTATPYEVSVAKATAANLGVVMPGEGMTVGNDGKLNVTPVPDKVTKIGNTVIGHKIADYTNEVDAIVDINETVTALTQNASGIHYQPEAGVIQDAKVVSADTGNLITTGADHGAFLNKNSVQGNQMKYEVTDGINTTVTVDSSVADLKKYKVNVATANGTNLGVVKQAATKPTVFINANGELSTDASAGNNIVEVFADYSIVLDDVVVLGDATSNNITIELPSAVGIKGRKLTVKKSDDANDTYVNVTSVAGNIDGEVSLYTSLPYSGWDFMSDGSNWKIVNKF